LTYWHGGAVLFLLWSVFEKYDNDDSACATNLSVISRVGLLTLFLPTTTYNFSHK
jgi:hypothetical protein